MTHWTRRELSAYLDGDLTPGESALVEEHLKRCRRCRAYFSHLQRIDAEMRERFKPILDSAETLVPTPLDPALLARLRQEPPQVAPAAARAASPPAAPLAFEPGLSPALQAWFARGKPTPVNGQKWTRVGRVEVQPGGGIVAHSFGQSSRAPLRREARGEGQPLLPFASQVEEEWDDRALGCRFHLTIETQPADRPFRLTLHIEGRTLTQQDTARLFPSAEAGVRSPSDRSLDKGSVAFGPLPDGEYTLVIEIDDQVRELPLQLTMR